MEKLTKENYYQSKLISNSSLSWLLPENGGSPAKFRQNMEKEIEDQTSAEMRLGTLIHKFVEMKSYDIFKVTQIPSSSIAEICEKVVEGNLDDLHGPLRDSIILKAAREADYQSNWKDDTVVRKIIEQGWNYIEDLIEIKKSGLIAISEDEDRQIRTIGEKIKNTIPWNFRDSIDENFEVINELPVTFVYGDFTEDKNSTVACKSLIDIVVINHLEKDITIFDLKTTSTPVSLYSGYTTHEVQIESNKVASIVEKNVEGVLYKRNVHRQLAFYRKAMLSLYPDYSVSSAKVVVVETNPPFDIAIVEVADIYLELGNKRIDYAMEQIISNSLLENELV